MSPASVDAHVDVAVVGGGPVGLFLAVELARRGVPVAVLERRKAPHGHSRSIGIHPPALQALEPSGVVARLVAEGVSVRGGLAFSGRTPLGSLDFRTLPGPYPFVLTLPQHRTEAILTERLGSMNPDALRWGIEVERVDATDDRATLSGARHLPDGSTEPFRLTARVAVGCDGHASRVRRSLGIPFQRVAYPDAFIMGDVADASDLGAEAAIYLTSRGVVESFPLPGGVRRWVVKTDARIDAPTISRLAEEVSERVGVDLDGATCTMLSSFGVERARADELVRGRVVLAGDSGHVVPPIGGQGMNLGWLDAADLAYHLPLALAGGEPEAVLAGYARRRRRAWRRGAARAAWNLRLGRATRWGWARDALVRTMLSPPLAAWTTRRFTMHGLAAGARAGRRG